MSVKRRGDLLITAPLTLATLRFTVSSISTLKTAAASTAISFRDCPRKSGNSASWLLSAGQSQTAALLPFGSNPRSVPRNEPAHKAPPPSSPALGRYAKGPPAAVVLLRRNRTDRPLQ